MSKINIFSLGGLNENGKNMYVIEVDNDIFVFEAGLQYADEHTLGIDYMIPNIEYLKNNKERIKGLFLTHGHDENVGAITDIIDTLDKVLEIHENGKVKRQEAEQQLEQIEGELKDKLLEIKIESGK